jgi:hypothetical protein
MRLSPILVATTVAFLTSNASAEVRKYTRVLQGQSIPTYLVAVTPPQGWFLNEKSSENTGLQIMTPKPTNSDVLIYVEAIPNNKGVEVSRAIALDQHGALQAQSDTKFTKMLEVARKNGADPFQIYRRDNPSKRHQPVEYVAYGAHREADNSLYFLTVTMSGHDPAAIEKYLPLYRDFLAAH